MEEEEEHEGEETVSHAKPASAEAAPSVQFQATHPSVLPSSFYLYQRQRGPKPQDGSPLSGP